MIKGIATRVGLMGPLAPYVEGFTTELTAQGYRPRTVEDHVRLLAHLSRWLAENRISGADLTEESLEQFLLVRGRQGYADLLSPRALAPLRSYLDRLGVLAAMNPPVTCTPVELLLAKYRSYLTRERGLTPGPVRLYTRVAQVFLEERFGSGELDLQRLSAGDVITFVLRQSRRRSVTWAKHLVTRLRSLLRFLHLGGWVPVSLAEAVPAVAGWSLASLPRALDAGQVARLLESCARDTAAGSRDFAILTLLARLGLRAHEVAALHLSDIDWRAGDIVIAGKGGQVDRLPLPCDVGEALVAYLSGFRPRCASRSLFISVRAPITGISPDGVGAVVQRACDRAGLPRVGSHRLRHTVATAMLQAGAPLSEIGQVLRHRSLSTTAIYAKVDRSALAMLALPWPGGEA